MDPVSIVTSIGSVGGTVFKVSTRLYSFIKATKSVDKSIEALYDEVKRLEAVLTTAEATLTETAMKHTKDPTLAIKGLWTSIENGVQDCRVTVEALDGLVQDVGTVTGTNNLFEKTFRQLKLNLSTDEITAVRGRIHNHTICLQLALEMLSVCLSCSSANNITDAVIPELGAITSKLDDLVSALARANMAQSDEEAHLPRTFQNADMHHHNRRLRDSAHVVLSVASTTMGLGSTQEDGSQYISNTLSESGVPLGNTRRHGRVGIEEWFQCIETAERDFESPGANSDLSTRSSTPIGQDTKSVKGPNMKPGDDLDLYVVKQAFEKAEQHWSKGDHAEAEKLFRTGMKRVDTLPPIKKQLFDLRDVTLKLAFTCLHQRKVEQAEMLFESLLKSLIAPKGSLMYALCHIFGITPTGYLMYALYCVFGNPPTTDEISCANHAYFGLTQAYICHDTLERAELMSKQRNDIWKARTGTTVDPLHSQGLQLMALIYELKGDSSLASLFADAEGPGFDETTPYMLPVELIREILGEHQDKYRGTVPFDKI